MKGLVFSEFIEMVEDTFGDDVADFIIEESALPSGGAYTAVGTYDHSELVTLVKNLSDKVNIPVDKLTFTFGQHLARIFYKKYPDFFAECANTLDFLKIVDNHIHVEVAKLYPDAELPKFTYDDSNPDKFELHYESKRGFADLAEGLIVGTSAHYNESFTIHREDYSTEDVCRVKFILHKQD
ncbi:heme NO-binding domain-containing protein [Flocculibacter collagenilyticus]|uniref:heme NO-binding domain-containing protein n=1 Tax=Flocculibacter collagenilyticus TaxID=2744479 RepID=UPI0018F7AA85|nr:heme NO-binding domain-containing protein [Flocculibacter collagenilyticus]